MSNPDLIAPAPRTVKSADANYEHDVAAITSYAGATHTHRAYRKDWQAFCLWCAEHRRPALPCTSQTLALYLAHLAKRLKVASIERALAAIAKVHRVAGHPSPRRSELVQEEMRSIRKALGCIPQGKDALLVDGIGRLVSGCDLSTLRGLRNRAIVLLGFAGAFRRSELVGLDVEDIEGDACGMRVLLRCIKTEHAGMGREKGIPFGDQEETCPVRAMQDWLSASGITSGAIFVSFTRHGALTNRRLEAREVARVIKQTATHSGLDADKLAGHSLRSGLVTAAAMAGKPQQTIMEQTGHASTTMLRRYIKRAKLFDNNAADGIGL